MSWFATIALSVVGCVIIYLMIEAKDYFKDEE